jgi:conjugal transfer ATP-binding protein TraC
MSELVRTNTRVITALVDQVPLSEFCTWINIEEFQEYNIIETTEGFGSVFEITVPVFMGEGMEDSFRQLLKESFPDNTVIHMLCWASNNITPIIERYKAHHKYVPNVDSPDILLEMIEKRGDYYLKAVQDGFWEGVKYKPRIFRNIISVHIPYSAFDNNLNEAFKSTKEHVSKLHSLLSSMKLNPMKLSGDGFKTLLSEIFNPEVKGIKKYDERRPLRNQVIDTTTSFKIVKDKEGHDDLHIQSGNKEKYLRLFSFAGFPRKINLWEFNNILFRWDVNSVSIPMSAPFGFCLSIKKKDWNKTKARIQSKALWNIKQAEQNALARYIPKISKRAQESQYIINLIEEGAIPLPAYYSFFVTEQTQSQLDFISYELKQRFESIGFELMRENGKGLVCCFLESLPMNNIPERANFLSRRNTLFDSNIASMLPFIGGTNGSGVLDEIYIDRKGQLVFFDRFTSDTNFNIVKVAESGGGKSFGQLNSHVHSLTSGAKVRVIDIGRSYETFCRDIGGEFIEITQERQPCFNFFTNMLTDENGNIMEEEMDSIVPLVGFLCGVDVSKQITEDGGENLNARYASLIVSAIDMAWNKKKEEAGLGDVADAFLEMEDAVGDGLGKKLYQAIEPYAKGIYRRYFNGKNNISYSKDYVVLELEEVEQKDTRLQAAIIFSIIVKALREVFIEWKFRKNRIVVDVDEAWSIFEKVAAKSFMESAARRFRKYDSSLGVITQQVDDMYKSPTTLAIWSNSAHKIFLKMQSNLIEKAVTEQKLVLDEFEKEWFKTLTTVPGKFSETFLLSPSCYGIVRLIVDRYSYGAFTTKASEKKQIYQLAKQYNVSVGQVLKMITERKPIGKFLVESGVPETLVYLALKYQAEERSDLKIGEILQMLGIDKKVIEEALKLQDEELSWEKIFG